MKHYFLHSLLLVAAVSMGHVACSNSPERLLTKRWVEQSWDYEKADANVPSVKRFDGIRIDAYEGRSVMRHEAEYWEFLPDNRFVVRLHSGANLQGKWRLKGRGHILTLRYDSGEVEVFDVKELDGDQLVLHFDLGVEVRGIARLEFRPEKGGKSS